MTGAKKTFEGVNSFQKFSFSSPPPQKKGVFFECMFHLKGINCWILMTFFVVLLAFCALVVGATELGRESLRQKLSNAPHLCVSCSVAPLWVHSKSDAHHFAWHEAFPLAHAVVILPAASKSFEGNSCLDGWTEGLHLPNSRCAYMICAQHLYLRTSFLRASLEESQIRKLYLLQTNTHKKERKRKEKKKLHEDFRSSHLESWI